MEKIMKEKSIVLNNNDKKKKIKEIIDKLSEYNSILDIGCGEGNILNQIKSPMKIGIDIFRPILEKNKYKKNIVFINYDLKKRLGKLFLSNFFDCTFGFDIIEHFDKKDAINLIKDCEEITSKFILFFIPVGNHPQTKDDRGYGNDYYQTHRSTWYPKEMIDLDYEVDFYPNWHNQKGKDSGAMFCYKEIKNEVK